MSSSLIDDIKKSLNRRSVDYLKILFLLPKEMVVSPEKFTGPRRIEELINNIKSRLDESLEHTLQLLEKIIKEVIEIKGDTFEIRECALVTECRKKIKEVKELKQALYNSLNEMRRIHVIEVSLLLSHLIRLHNLILHDLKSRVNPSRDGKVWDYIGAINILTLQYGVEIVSKKDFPLEEGFIDYLLREPSDESLRIYSSILSEHIPWLSCKNHLELIEEKLKES